MNSTLYKHELRKSLKLLMIFIAVMALYITIIIGMFEPDMIHLLDDYAKAMPEIMAAVGMKAGSATLLDFIISYLYGFILLVFPMVYCMLRGNSLIARYTDKGSLVYLTGAPVNRRSIAATQILTLITGILILLLFVTGLEIGIAEHYFPGELPIFDLLKVNVGLLSLHLFIGAICFLFSCLFSDARYSLAFGAGIPAFMFVLQMLANTGESAEKIKYFTFFTLYDASGIAAHETSAISGAVLLFLGAILLYIISIIIFCRKDLHI